MKRILPTLKLFGSISSCINLVPIVICAAYVILKEHLSISILTIQSRAAI